MFLMKPLFINLFRTSDLPISTIARRNLDLAMVSKTRFTRAPAAVAVPLEDDEEDRYYNAIKYRCAHAGPRNEFLY